MRETSDPMAPGSAPMQDRLRRLPEALLLTAGYLASQIPTLSRILRGPE